MKLNRYIVTTLGTAIALLGVTSSAEALVASVKAFGMAGTGVAYPQDALVNAYNPAGNAEIGDRLDAGLYWGRNRGHLKISGNTLNANPLFNAIVGGPVNGKFNAFRTKDVYPADFGVNKTFGCECEWAFGLSVYNRQFQKTTYNEPLVLVGRSNPGLEYVHQTIATTVAYRWNECFSVGLNVNWMVQRFKINGLERVDQGAPSLTNGFVYSAHPGHVTNRGYDYSFGVTAQLGVLWHITPTIAVGATYQPETKMSRVDKYKGILAPNGKFNIPQNASFGLSWRFLPCATFCFDYQWYDWEQINALAAPLLHDGHIEPLGSRNGPGFGWKSQHFFRFGFDYAFTDDIIVRAGYRYAKTPTRASQTVLNALAMDLVEQYVTVGATYVINDCYEVSSCFAWGFEKTLKGKNSIPTNSPLGNPPGFGGGEADITEQKFLLGVSFGWNF